jgi:DNA-binding IscR family transcriptional regulator
MKSASGNPDHLFRFVTNHAHVLQVIAAEPTARLRDIAQTVGITERTAAHIVNELEQAGYLSKSRNGRRNHYELHEDLPLRHPQHRHHTVGDLIRFLEAPAQAQQSNRRRTAVASAEPARRRRAHGRRR